MSTLSAVGASETLTKALDRFQRWRRIVLALLIGIILTALLFVRSAPGSDDGLRDTIGTAGVVLILVAILGRIWCTLYIGGRKNLEIVREGPYSVTRNPLYVFSALGAAGIGALTGSVVVAAGFAVLAYLAFRSVARVEEDYLERIFGEPYRRYMSETPRFFPKLGLFRDSDMLSVPPQLFYRTVADGLMFLTAYPFFKLVDHLQGADILPVLLRLP